MWGHTLPQRSGRSVKGRSPKLQGAGGREARVSRMRGLGLELDVCLLGGLLFGPVTGGLSAGIGSALFDFMDPAYAPEAWITFINKFLMGFVAGAICRMGRGKGPKMEKLFTLIGGISGAGTYVILYVSKTIIVQYFINSGVWATVAAVAIQKGTVSLVNGLIAVVVSSFLAFSLRPALRKAHLFDNI